MDSRRADLGALEENYALMEASYAAVRLIQTFSRVEARDDRPWKEHLGLNLSNEHGTVIEVHS